MALPSVRVAKKVFFFYQSSHSVNFPSDPVRAVVPYRHPLARACVGCLPSALKRAFLRLSVTERIVEYPFVWRYLDVPLGATILDVGATGSKLALELANYGYKVIAVDIRHYPFAHPNLCSWRGDFLANPFPAASVEATVAVSTIEHVGIPYYGGAFQADGDLRAMLEIWRLLKPGGSLLLTVPYGQAARSHHQRVYDAAGLEALLERFQIDQVSFYRRENGCCWLPTQETGMHTTSSVYQTEGVALVRAHKPLTG